MQMERFGLHYIIAPAPTSHYYHHDHQTTISNESKYIDSNIKFQLQ